MSKLLLWVKGNSTIIVNAGSLIGTTAVTSLLGFVYWWIAARRCSPEAVGISSAAVSAMMLLGNFSIMGMGTLLITELPRQPGRAKSLVSTALLIVGMIGCAVGLLFALLAPYISSSFAPLRANPLTIAFFSLGVGTTAISQVLDQALIGLLRGGMQLWRNTLFSIAKLLLVFVVSMWLSSDGMMIYATWPLSIVLSLLLLLPFALRHSGERGTIRTFRTVLQHYQPQWGLLRRLGMSAIQHHLLNLTLQFPALVLPMLVTVLLSAKMNAWFYVSWMIANFVFLVPNALTIVLHAVNSAQQATLTQKARVTASLALLTCLLANGAIQIAPELVLGFFGNAYAAQASLVLRVLVIAAFPLLIKNHYISICRIQDRIIRAMVALLPGSVLELVAAAIGAHMGGLVGLGIAWVAALSVESLFMVPTVYRVIRGGYKREQSPSCEHMPLPATDAIWLIDTFPLPIFVPPVRIAVGASMANERQGAFRMMSLPAKKDKGVSGLSDFPGMPDIAGLNTGSSRHTRTTWPVYDHGGQFRPWPRPTPIGAAFMPPARGDSTRHDAQGTEAS